MAAQDRMRVLTTAELDVERRMIEAAQMDSRAFAELYARHFDRVYAFAVTRTESRGDAEEVTAETFARALRNLGRFEWRGVPFSAWLLQIAARAAADQYRRRRREAPLDAAGDGAAAVPDAELADVEARADL